MCDEHGAQRLLENRFGPDEPVPDVVLPLDVAATAGSCLGTGSTVSATESGVEPLVAASPEPAVLATLGLRALGTLLPMMTFGCAFA
jgi:hypothetical protein